MDGVEWRRGARQRNAEGADALKDSSSRLAGFRNALGIGVTTLETDLALTRDGVLVLSHDPRLAAALTRGPDGAWLAADGAPFAHLDLADLARYDVGRLNPAHKYASQWPEQKAFDGERIPTLVSLFALAREARSPGGQLVRFNIETKLTPDSEILTADPTTFARAVVAAVLAADMGARVSVQSFDWRTLVEVRRLAPQIATVCLTIESSGMNTVRVADRRGLTLARRSQGGGPRRFAAAPRAGRRLLDLVAFLAQRQRGTRPGSARAWPQGRSVDRQRAGRNGTSGGAGRRRPDHRLPGPRAACTGGEGHRGRLTGPRCWCRS